MKLRSGKIINRGPSPRKGKIHRNPSPKKPVPPKEKPKICEHPCECTSLNGCCACNDKRPKELYYTAHNKSRLEDFTIVNRSYYYCRLCKNSHANDMADLSSMDLPTYCEKLKDYNKTLHYLLKKRDERISSLNQKIMAMEHKLWDLQKSGSR